jgi:pyridoxine 4-dehydrogenase
LHTSFALIVVPLFNDKEKAMSTTNHPGTYLLGTKHVRRLGYGAMQLAGQGVFGPPKDIDAALAVLREALELGVNHIDTSDFYGPHITNQLIRRALHPYRKDLVIVTKVGARRDAHGAWLPAFSADTLQQAIHDNLRNLGLDVLEVVNLRSMFDVHQPAEGSLEEPLTVLAELRQQGLIRHIGLSNVTMKQVEEAKRIVPLACVQNMYNLAHRHDEAMIDALGREGIPYVPFFPLGGFTRLQSDALSAVAERTGRSALQVAIAWLLQRAPNILPIPGTSSVAHLRENLAAAEMELAEEDIAALDGIAAVKEEAGSAA